MLFRGGYGKDADDEDDIESLSLEAHFTVKDVESIEQELGLTLTEEERRQFLDEQAENFMVLATNTLRAQLVGLFTIEFADRLSFEDEDAESEGSSA